MFAGDKGAFFVVNRGAVGRNGNPVVRRLVGYGRLEGEASAAILDELHQRARLNVNFFLPCFKLKSKTRQGAKVSWKFEPPRTPYELLLAIEALPDDRNDYLRATFVTLDYLRWVADGILWESRWNCVHGYRQLRVLLKGLELAIVKSTPVRHASVA